MSDQRKILTPFQMLLLTFMRLRLDLPAQHLVHLFRVSPKTVFRTFNEIVSFLKTNLRHSIVRPDRDTLHKIMPHQFVEAFGHGVLTWMFWDFHRETIQSESACPNVFQLQAQLWSIWSVLHPRDLFVSYQKGGAAAEVMNTEQWFSWEFVARGHCLGW